MSDSTFKDRRNVHMRLKTSEVLSKMLLSGRLSKTRPLSAILHVSVPALTFFSYGYVKKPVCPRRLHAAFQSTNQASLHPPVAYEEPKALPKGFALDMMLC